TPLTFGGRLQQERLNRIVEGVHQKVEDLQRLGDATGSKVDSGKLKLRGRKGGSSGEFRLRRVNILCSQVAATDVVPARIDHGGRGRGDRLFKDARRLVKSSQSLQGIGPCVQDLEPVCIHLRRAAE